MKVWPCLTLATVCVLAGCRTKEMQSTPFYEGGGVEYVGDASERVNLWPIAYWRNPVGSVVWPLASFSDDHFALRPVYSQYRQNGRNGEWDEYNLLWPIAQADTRNRDYRFFPAFWGDSCEPNKGYQAVFPLYWNGPRYNALFPLWYVDNTGLFTTLLYGQTRDSHWVLPLWYKGAKTFVSPLYAQGVDENVSWWAAPVALSWGNAKKFEKGRSIEHDKGNILLLFGGWDAEWGTERVKRGKKEVPEARDRGEWWCFPFVSRKWDMYPRNDRYRSRFETVVACGLSKWVSRGGDLESVSLIPLFSWNDDGSWLTPLGGRIVDNDCTKTILTPLAGVRSGKVSGGWLFPLWSHKKDSGFDRLLQRIDAPKLPDDIEVTVHTNENTNGEHCEGTFLRGRRFSAHDDTVVLLHDADHVISGRGDNRGASSADGYTITERRKRGNRLLFNYGYERSAKFDLKSREKLQDAEKSEASFLVRLYWYEWNHDRLNAKDHARHRVLWRLWDWEDDDGDVSLDVFPGFTYDSRRDGHTKTSFLWRFFRYETAPDKSTKLDLLYIPILR